MEIGEDLAVAGIGMDEVLDQELDAEVPGFVNDVEDGIADALDEFTQNKKRKIDSSISTADADVPPGELPVMQLVVQPDMMEIHVDRDDSTVTHTLVLPRLVKGSRGLLLIQIAYIQSVTWLSNTAFTAILGLDPETGGPPNVSEMTSMTLATHSTVNSPGRAVTEINSYWPFYYIKMTRNQVMDYKIRWKPVYVSPIRFWQMLLTHFRPNMSVFYPTFDLTAPAYRDFMVGGGPM